MDKLSIGEVAKRANIAASAIRYYESEGLIPPAGRVRGRRVYDPPVIARLALIHLAKSAGFTIAEIRKLLAGVSRSAPPGARWRELAERKLAELEQRISEAQRMKAVLKVVTGCECPTLDDCARAIENST